MEKNRKQSKFLNPRTQDFKFQIEMIPDQAIQEIKQSEGSYKLLLTINYMLFGR